MMILKKEKFICINYNYIDIDIYSNINNKSNYKLEIKKKK